MVNMKSSPSMFILILVIQYTLKEHHTYFRIYPDLSKAVKSPKSLKVLPFAQYWVLLLPQGKVNGADMFQLSTKQSQTPQANGTGTTSSLGSTAATW